MRTAVGGATARFDIEVFDGADAAVTGLVTGDFTKYLTIDGASDSGTVTVTEVANGRYTVTFTAPAVSAGSRKYVRARVLHATYGPRGWAEDFEVVNADARALEGSLLTGSVTNAAPTTTAFRDSTKSATDDFYNGCVIAFTSGTLKGLARKTEDYAGATKEFTVDALPAAPAQNDTFVILGRIDDD